MTPGEEIKLDELGIAKDKIKKILITYCDRVQEKLDDRTIDTETVHEDIRVMHHIIAIERKLSDSPLA